MLLALLGLLMAFTFSGAWTRFDARRDLIVREANAIGSAWMLLDLLPATTAEPLRDSFRRYVDLRLAATRADEARPSAEIDGAQRAIWRASVAAAQAAPDGRISQSLLPAVNAMTDVATARYQAVLSHTPQVVFLLLLTVMMIAAMLAGHGMAGGERRNWLHIGCFLGAMILTLYVTVDLEYPRRGLMRLDGFDQVLIDLRAGMK
ncbi:MAG: hypothetical protein JNL39_13545 [Opitutaceae bacterium]|nr:hypothetical protein [Opitutaceae bacterium]